MTKTFKSLIVKSEVSDPMKIGQLHLVVIILIIILFQYFYLNPGENAFVIHHVQKLINENVNITVVLCRPRNKLVIQQFFFYYYYCLTQLNSLRGL